MGKMNPKLNDVLQPGQTVEEAIARRRAAKFWIELEIAALENYLKEKEEGMSESAEALQAKG